MVSSELPGLTRGVSEATPKTLKSCFMDCCDITCIVLADAAGLLVLYWTNEWTLNIQMRGDQR